MKKFLALLIFASTLLSCEKVETIKSADYDYVVNFEAMWSMVDDHYIFMDYKGVDWDKVYQDLKPRVLQCSDEFELFEIMSEALALLRDGHVALISDFQIYGSDYCVDKDGNEYPRDYVSGLVGEHYLTKSYYSRSGITFGHIERDGRKYAYIHYPSFMIEALDVDFKYISKFVDSAEGIIFDVRDNTGGAAAYGMQMAGHFFDEETVVGYSANKVEPGSFETTDPESFSVFPATKYNWSEIPTVLLSNRAVYSTGNIFVNTMKFGKNVTVVGGRSGGGAGLPVTSLLPNGWLLCFPSNVLLDINKESIEDGVDPDIEVHITEEDKANNIDTIVEKAIELLSNK